MTISILENILVVLITALFVSVVFRYLRFPVILGYFVVGALIGPHGLRLLPDVKIIKDLADFGVVFLIFTIGLEFSLSKLFALKYSVFVLGGAQVILSILATTVVGHLLGMTVLEALIVGGIVAMSSTAIVMKQLKDQFELNSPHGLNAIGILLFQDLAVIPILILFAGLSTGANGSLFVILLWSVIKGVFAAIVILALGRWLLKPLFQLIASTRVIELFTLTVLLVALAAAWLTNKLGLSYVLGAFLAGMMLSESQYRYQIEIEIRPFRDILLGLFFITVGMLLNVTMWYETWIWILLLLAALLFGKLILIYLLCRISGSENSSALRTGLVLAQGGEFGFAILSVVLVNRLLPPDYGQVVLSALILSFALAPVLIYFNKYITQLVFPKTLKAVEEKIQTEIVGKTMQLKDHIILCGYGRVGQNVARFLEKEKIPYIGIDLDPVLVNNASLAGANVVYGDATHPDILQASRIDVVKALVISFDDVRSAIKILNLVREKNKKLPILVRCKDMVEFDQLQSHGATRIIAEIYEESLTLAYHLLQYIRVPQKKIIHLLHEVREKDYELLRKVYPGEFEEELETGVALHEQLRPILLFEGAFAIDHRLGELKLNQFSVEVIAIRHGGEKPVKPHANVKLRAGDIIILFGAVDKLEEAERFLLKG